jgi:hypothetical protein
MRSLTRRLGLAVLVGIAALGVFLVPTIWGRPWSIDHFYLRVFAELALERPQLLSRLRILEPWGSTGSRTTSTTSVEFRTETAPRWRASSPGCAGYDRSRAEREPAALDRRPGAFLALQAGGASASRLPREPDGTESRTSSRTSC